ncbi:MAG: toll/interleukin-1 receptor domain-containing protein [Pseudomonadota bacterium]
MSSKVFLSYRRSDAGWAATALHAELSRVLGDGQVFLDVSSLALGHSWSEALNEALDACDVAVILIGPTWLECKDPAKGTRRLDDENDLVRIEIMRSLERGIPVVPITLDDTKLPSVSQLPKGLEELVDQLLDRQGMPIRQASFRSDVAGLIERTRIAETPAIPPKPAADPAAADLRALLIQFLRAYRQWSFSALRVANWGAQQPGFETLANVSKDEIRVELDSMVSAGIAKTRLSKKGGTLYRLV